jgi:hypothetical protein
MKVCNTGSERLARAKNHIGIHPRAIVLIAPFSSVLELLEELVARMYASGRVDTVQIQAFLHNSHPGSAKALSGDPK